MARGEIAYQSKLMNKLRDLLPGCFVIKTDPAKNQGIPDILVLFGGKWAMLEVKMAADSATRPNQPYYVEKFNDMSFAAFIHPQNEEKVLNDLQSALRSRRSSRLSKSKQLPLVEL